MFECREMKEFGVKRLCFEGRIDAMTARETEKAPNDMLLSGERVFGADFEKVNCISSAGLRIFMRAQKQLGSVGGEIAPGES
jgi:anti-sigma B factor antagonist